MSRLTLLNNPPSAGATLDLPGGRRGRRPHGTLRYMGPGPVGLAVVASGAAAGTPLVVSDAKDVVNDADADDDDVDDDAINAKTADAKTAGAKTAGSRAGPAAAALPFPASHWPAETAAAHFSPGGDN
jgi:hypothetical protein